MNTPSNMTTFYSALCLFGMFALAYNIQAFLHECGHAAFLYLGGGKASHMTLSPFSWSYLHYSHAPKPLLSAWGGVVGGLTLCLLPLIIVRILAIPTPRFVLVLGVVSMAVNGVYLLAGALSNLGDGADLIRLGMPRSLVLSVGALLILVAAAWVLMLQPSLGIDYTASFLTRVQILLGGIGSYLVLMLIYNACFQRADLGSCMVFVSGGLLFVGFLILTGALLGSQLARIPLAQTPVYSSSLQAFIYSTSAAALITLLLFVFRK